MMISGQSRVKVLASVVCSIVLVSILAGCQAASLMSSRSDTSSIDMKLNGCNRLGSIGYYRLDDETSVARLKRDFNDCVRYAKALEDQGILVKQIDSVNSRFSYIK